MFHMLVTVIHIHMYVIVIYFHMLVSVIYGIYVIYGSRVGLV